MKINFEQIFNSPSKNNTPLLTSSVLLDQPTHSLNNSFKSFNKQFHYKSFHSEMHHQDLFDKEHIKQKPKNNSITKSQISAFDQLKTINQMIQKQQENNKKNIKHVEQITEKLYHPPKCHKRQCKQFINTKEEKILKEQFQLANKFQLSNQNKKIIEKNNDSKESKNQTYQRLHGEWIKREFKKLQIQENKKEKSESKSQNKRTEMFNNFLDKLEVRINKSKQKQKVYEQNPNLATNDPQKFFSPKLIQTKRSKKLRAKISASDSRHNKKSKQDMQNDTIFNQTLNTSLQSINKSFELVKQTQEHFFNKMKIIFCNEEEDITKIHPQAIELLTEVQFNVMFMFLHELDNREDKDQISSQQFQNMLREYYYSLPTKEKQELRSHQTQNKNHLKKVQKQIESAKISSRVKARTLTNATNYHKRLNTYV